MSDTYVPYCHTLLGTIFIDIDWPLWITRIPEEASPKVHSSLLHLIIKLSNEPNVRQVTTSVLNAHFYSWLTLLESGFGQYFISKSNSITFLYGEVLSGIFIALKIIHYWLWFSYTLILVLSKWPACSFWSTKKEKHSVIAIVSEIESTDVIYRTQMKIAHMTIWLLLLDKVTYIIIHTHLIHLTFENSK